MGGDGGHAEQSLLRAHTNDIGARRCHVVPSPAVRGRDREGECGEAFLLMATPSPTLPRKRGREQAL